MAQVATLRPSTIRPNSMPTLPELMQFSSDLQFDLDPNNLDQKSGLVEWVQDGKRCALDAAHRFRPFRRRHHCRACGLLVCSSCSRSSRPLPGFGLSGNRPHRLCDACAIRSNEDLESLATLWQAVSNKNSPAFDLADAMNAVSKIGFLFAQVNSPNWAQICQHLLSLLQLEIGVVQNMLEELLTSADLTVSQIDDMALRRAHRLMKTLKESGRHVPILLPESFRVAFNGVLELREHSDRREAIAFHHNRMMALLQKPFADVTMDDAVTVWGAYQAWAEDNRLAVSTALESRVRELLNRVVRRDQSAASAQLEIALNSKSFVQIQKAMITCDAVMAVLVQSHYRDHVMPDIHVVIPGFAAHRRSATKLLADASRKKLVRRDLRKKSLYPPKRI